MYWPLYQTLVLFAAACTLVLFVRQQAVVPLGLTSTSLWATLSLQARDIVVRGANDPTVTTTVGSTAWQFVALALSILTFAAVVLWFFGAYPPSDEERLRPDERAEPDDRPTPTEDDTDWVRGPTAAQRPDRDRGDSLS